MPYSVQVVFLSVIFPGGIRLQDLCMMKEVVIPDGVERIGAYWFFGSEVENVKISTSIREIGKCAFCNCWKLKQIVFSENGQLEKIGRECFR